MARFIFPIKCLSACRNRCVSKLFYSTSAVLRNRDTHKFLFEKYATTVPELQKLINIILRSKGKTRTAQILPKEVVTSFCGRFESMTENDKGHLLNDLALSCIPSPVEITAFYNRFHAALGSGPLEDPHKVRVFHNLISQVKGNMGVNIFILSQFTFIHICTSTF